MRVLNICVDDWANFMFENMKALRSVGVECDAYKENKHSFGYAEEATILPMTEIARLIKGYDVVQIFHSCLRSLAIVQYHDVKKIVYHTGSAYRSRPEDMNMLFNPVVDLSMTDQTEFMKLGAKNLSYIAVAVDTHKLKAEKIVGTNLRFLHCPSNPAVKGSEQIIEMMSKVSVMRGERKDFIFAYHLDQIDHEDNIERMKNCDVYIELFKPFLNGKHYGCFGVTAFEAASLGKIVVTQNMNKNVYDDVYGDTPFLIPETEEQFIKAINFLIDRHNLSINNTIAMQQMHREAMKKTHSYEATGKYLMKFL